MGSRTYSFDSKMLLSDNAAAYTSSSIGQVASANAILDLGGAQESGIEIGSYAGGLARLDAMCVLDVTALVASNSDDLYRLALMGSNNSGGSSPVVLAELELGNTAALINGATTSVAGRYELPFTNEQADITYEYLFLYVSVAGTSKSISVHAFVAPLPLE